MFYAYLIGKATTFIAVATVLSMIHLAYQNVWKEFSRYLKNRKHIFLSLLSVSTSELSYAQDKADLLFKNFLAALSIVPTMNLQRAPYSKNNTDSMLYILHDA